MTDADHIGAQSVWSEMATKLTYTFDNGPWPAATDRLLDFLAETGIKASFFAVGQQVADPVGRRLVERAAEEGHWIGNHTYSHGTPLGQDGDAERVAREIGDTQALLGGLSHPSKLFRPNGGGALGSHLLSQSTVEFLSRNKFTVVTWNSIPRDWIAPHEDWLDRALDELDHLDWPVLVLHDRFIAEMLDTLACFHEAVVARGIEVVQDFNPDCVLMREGFAELGLNEMVAP